MRLYPWLVLFLMMLSAAGCRHGERIYEVPLDETIFNNGVPPWQYRFHYFRRQDTTRHWRQLDSLIRGGEQPLAPANHTLLEIGPNDDRYVRIRAGDVSVGRSRFRLGLAFAEPAAGDTATGGQGPVFLFVGPYGRDSLGLDLDRNNIGRLRPYTYFQVDRQFFQLLPIDTLSGRLRFRRVERQPNAQLTARYNTGLGKVPVLDEKDERVFLDWPRGRRHLIVLWSLGPDRGGLVSRLNAKRDSLANWQITTINMLDRRENVRRFVREHDIRLPAYRVSSQTCRALNCHSYLPYGIILNEQGQVEDDYVTADDLRRRFSLQP